MPMPCKKCDYVVWFEIIEEIKCLCFGPNRIVLRRIFHTLEWPVLHNDDGMIWPKLSELRRKPVLAARAAKASVVTAAVELKDGEVSKVEMVIETVRPVNGMSVNKYRDCYERVTLNEVWRSRVDGKSDGTTHFQSKLTLSPSSMTCGPVRVKSASGLYLVPVCIWQMKFHI